LDFLDWNGRKLAPPVLHDAHKIRFVLRRAAALDHAVGDRAKGRMHARLVCLCPLLRSSSDFVAVSLSPRLAPSFLTCSHTAELGLFADTGRQRRNGQLRLGPRPLADSPTAPPTRASAFAPG